MIAFTIKTLEQWQNPNKCHFINFLSAGNVLLSDKFIQRFVFWHYLNLCTFNQIALEKVGNSLID